MSSQSRKPRNGGPALRILLGTMGTLSHFSPLVAVGQGLKRRGHAVRVAAGGKLGPAVTDAGFEHLKVGPDWPEAPEEGASPSEYEALLKRFMLTRSVQATVRELGVAFRSWRPDVVIMEPYGLGAMIAAELASIPHVLCGSVLRPYLFALGPPDDPDRASRISGHGFAEYWRYRAGLGLEEDRDFIVPSRYLKLDMIPPSLHLGGPDGQVGARRALPVRPTLWRAETTAAPGWIASLPRGRPLVHLTLGTTFDNDVELLRTLIHALAGEDLMLLVASARGEKLGPLPANVRVERWVDHAAVLPLCKVVIHHGGWSSTLGCLEQGVPAVILPQAADQPLNATKVAQVGAGIAIPPRSLTPTLLRQAVRRCLAEPLFRANAERLRAELCAMPSMEDVLPALEMLASEGAGGDGRGASSAGGRRKISRRAQR